jgi:hypothetical protein
MNDNWEMLNDEQRLLKGVMKLCPGHTLSFIPRAWAHEPGTVNGNEFFVGCNNVIDEVNQKRHNKI